MTLANEIHRRTFLSGMAGGLGVAALQSLLSRDAVAAPATGMASDRGLPGLPHFAPKAKRVIWLYMSGGPSQFETFDEKPKLSQMDGQPMPESFTKGQPIAQLQGQTLKCQGAMTKFQRHGKSGQAISDFLPWHGKMADDLCIIRSMVTEQINHDPAHAFMNAGSAINGRPSMGAWVNYGLGSESDDLPGFVVMTSEGGRNPQPISSRQWAAGFLPAQHQGVMFNSKGDPVHYLGRPAGVDAEQQARLVETVQALDRRRYEQQANSELAARIEAYEMAFRMQTSVPALLDMSDERRENAPA